MLALRTLPGDDATHDTHAPASPAPAEWLTVEQAACDLGVSSSTVRRRIRAGALRSRFVIRNGRRACLVHVPGSRHAAALAPLPPTVIDLTARIRLRERQRAIADPEAPHQAIQRLEQQVDHLSEALARALRVRARQSAGTAITDPTDPYRRYRDLVRRRRWWPFS